MSAPAIRVEGLWKEYVIGSQAAGPGSTFREAMMDAVSAPWRRLKGARSGSSDEQRFWALQDVNFEVQPGEVVGIIGRNGAGKSTLLKILSQITAPTRGQVQIRGRIASLLEVGTGFHPELTGRENIRLNGAILGMSAAEIRKKFDEIVAFAGVDRFIDTPVKRYSSGMQVRLAFAVAAHLEPEILVIDEVLAVGDAEFQKKCLGKMGEIAGKGGRTVLFVSHQLGMVARLCSRAVMLSQGTLAFSGSSDETIEKYVAQGASRDRQNLADAPGLRDLPVAVTDIQTVAPDGKAAGEFAWHVPFRVRVHLRLKPPQSIGGTLLGIAIDNRHAARLTTWVTRLADYIPDGAESGEVELEIAPRIIAPGGYTLTVALFEPGRVYQKLEGECPFVIVDSGSEMAEFSNTDYGVVIIPATWSGTK